MINNNKKKLWQCYTCNLSSLQLDAFWRHVKVGHVLGYCKLKHNENK